jgi:hypothetical protein
VETNRVKISKPDPYILKRHWLNLARSDHYHDVVDPARFGLIDFKVLLLEKPSGAPKDQFTETKGYRWYSQK